VLVVFGLFPIVVVRMLFPVGFFLVIVSLLRGLLLPRGRARLVGIFGIVVMRSFLVVLFVVRMVGFLVVVFVFFFVVMLVAVRMVVLLPSTSSSSLTVSPSACIRLTATIFLLAALARALSTHSSLSPPT
jgi:hypothetical protein